MLERLLYITQRFQFSRLVRRQWRTIPAVAIASWILNAYKRRSVLTAQNADDAPTTVGVRYLRLMINVETDTCALHICAWPKNLLFTNHCSVEAKLIILWNTILALTEQRSTEYEICLLCVNVFWSLHQRFV